MRLIQLISLFSLMIASTVALACPGHAEMSNSDLDVAVAPGDLADRLAMASAVAIEILDPDEGAPPLLQGYDDEGLLVFTAEDRDGDGLVDWAAFNTFDDLGQLASTEVVEGPQATLIKRLTYEWSIDALSTLVSAEPAEG